jgi:hypothetical protein
MKKAGVTKKKRNRKREREKDGTFVLFRKLVGPRRSVLEGWTGTHSYARAILYSGKLVQYPDSTLAVAKYLAEEIRTDPPTGWRLVAQQVKRRRNVKGFVPKMLKALGEYLEDEQLVFNKMDSQIADIVAQHPDYTVKEITFELSKKYPEQKWTEQKLKTLARRVQRLLKNVPR